ncbi:hypothetical protein CK203_055530 [Vitis vinifera]|uniref:Retrotransposon gag domain-containing protein n=1 Tax=Vitis vinifera TaxID=29760 RepID=A0A438GXS2_VITVI|nr:hypothetical protein CK203_055530 [Vitis vinifera]
MWRSNKEAVDDRDLKEGGEKLLETPEVIYTKPLVGRVWKLLEKPRDVHTSLHYGGRHEKSLRLSREFQRNPPRFQRLPKVPINSQHGGKANQGGDSHANTWEGVDLIEQDMEKGLKDIREQIKDLYEGHGVKVEALVARMKARDQESGGAKATHVQWQEGCQGAGQLLITHGERFADIEKRTCTIDTWDAFKQEIKRQFYPEDVTYLARKNMKCLKHMARSETWCPRPNHDHGGSGVLGGIQKGDFSKPKPQSKGNHAKGGRDKGSRATLLRKDQARPLVARMAKARANRRSSCPEPTASYVTVHTGHETTPREKP